MVAATLEKQWEAALDGQQRAEEEFENLTRQKPLQLSDEERERIVALSKEIPLVWQLSTTSNKDRKEIIRCLVEKVVASTQADSELVDVTIHWFGGYTSQHQIVRRVAKYSQLQDYSKLMARLVELRRQGKSSTKMAAILAEEDYAMPRHCRKLTPDTIAYLLCQSPCRELLRRPNLSPHEWLAEDLARELELPVKKLKTWVTRGWVLAIQRPHGGVWVVWADEADLRRLKRLTSHTRGDGPLPPELKQPGHPPTPERR